MVLLLKIINMVVVVLVRLEHITLDLVIVHMVLNMVAVVVMVGAVGCVAVLAVVVLSSGRHV